jgi:hypothetical protein
MKKLVLISILVVAMGVMAFNGCEKPEEIEIPVASKPQTTDSTVINTQTTDMANQQTEDTLTNQQGDTIPTQSSNNLSDVLIGTWIEVSPCDSCRTYTFTETDSIFLIARYDNFVYKMSYYVVNEDSIQVIRLWDIEPSKKTTTNNVVILSSDTIRINQFLPVDLGIIGFQDVVLTKIL